MKKELRIARSELIVFIIALLAVIPACGKAQKTLAPVEGKVLYRGKPLQYGSVIFVPKGGGQMARGVIQADGSFKLSTGSEDGAAVGRHGVRITCYGKNSTPGSAHAASPDDQEQALGRSLIPQKYTRTQTSGLEADVKDGENEPFIFDMQ